MRITHIAAIAGIAISFAGPVFAADTAIMTPAAATPAVITTAEAAPATATPAPPLTIQPQGTPINVVNSMPDGTEVTITGTVENFDSRHPFTLRDSSGSVSVDLTDARPIVLHNGQKVTITGDVDKGLLGSVLGPDVAATDVRL